MKLKNISKHRYVLKGTVPAQAKDPSGPKKPVVIEPGETADVDDKVAQKHIDDYPEHFVEGKAEVKKPAKPAPKAEPSDFEKDSK